MWLSRDTRNSLVPAFDEHPERRLKDYLDDIQDYLRSSELPNGEGPYGSTANLFRASVTHVARRTIGMLPDAEITVLRKTYALRPLEFTPAAAKLIEYSIMDSAINATEKYPTGSSLCRGTVLKALEDMHNEALYVVVEILAGGSIISLQRADESIPSNMGKEFFFRISIVEVALRFYTMYDNGVQVNHSALYRDGVVNVHGGGYIKPNAVYQLLSERQRFPEFDANIFRGYERRFEAYDAPRASVAELARQVQTTHRNRNKPDTGFPVHGNDCIITSDYQTGHKKRVTVYQGLRGVFHEVRTQTILEKYRCIGVIDSALHNKLDQLVVFNSGDHHVTALLVMQTDLGPDDTFDPRDLFEWVGRSPRGPPSIANIAAWPADTIIATATEDVDPRGKAILFNDSEQLHPAPGSSQAGAVVLAGAVAITADPGKILCLDEPPAVDEEQLDFNEISLSLPVDLPWASEQGALCALYDSIDLPFE